MFPLFLLFEKKMILALPTKFNLFMDRPWDIFIYPRVGFKNEKNQMSFKVYKENIEKEKFLFHLEAEGQNNDSYTISPMYGEKDFPYKVLFLSASTLNISYIDDEKYSGRRHTVIANCKTWSLSKGKGGKNQI